MSGHVDVSVLARAPLDDVWHQANSPGEWAAADHAVEVLEQDGNRMRFRVVVPVGDGATLSYCVERTTDQATRTVYSRRFDSPDFRYSHVWFSYQPVDGGTRIRCVVDFEMDPTSGWDDESMTRIMRAGLERNLTRTAELVEQRQPGGNHDNSG